MSSKDFAIGVLGITAAVLLVGLLGINALRPQAAYGFGQNATGGRYVIGTSQFDVTTELLYVLDTSLEQMNVYIFSIPANRLELLRSLDVRWRQGAGQPRPGAGRAPEEGPGR